MRSSSTLSIAAALALLFALQAPGHATPTAKAAKPAPAAASTAPRVISWDDLVPKDWDPQREFKGMDFSKLSDSDPRAAVLLKRLREIWDSAPSNPAMNGVQVRLPGYVVPLEETREGLKEFLLVPYFGACIHTPPPPANQIIHVRARTPMKALGSMDTVWIQGALKPSRSDTVMGVTSYTMDAAVVERYSDTAR